MKSLVSKRLLLLQVRLQGKTSSDFGGNLFFLQPREEHGDRDFTYAEMLRNLRMRFSLFSKF